MMHKMGMNLRKLVLGIPAINIPHKVVLRQFSFCLFMLYLIPRAILIRSEVIAMFSLLIKIVFILVLLENR